MIFSEWLSDVYGYVTINDLVKELMQEGYNEKECETHIKQYIQEYKEYCSINKIIEEYDI